MTQKRTQFEKAVFVFFARTITQHYKVRWQNGLLSLKATFYYFISHRDMIIMLIVYLISYQQTQPKQELFHAPWLWTPQEYCFGRFIQLI